MAGRKRHPQPPKTVKGENRSAPHKTGPEKPKKKAVVLRKRQDKPTPPYKTTQPKPSPQKKKPTYTSKKPTGFDPLDLLGPRPARTNIVEDSEWSPSRFGPIKPPSVRPLNPESAARIDRTPGMSRDEQINLAFDYLAKNGLFEQQQKNVPLWKKTEAHWLRWGNYDPFNPKSWQDWAGLGLGVLDVATAGALNAGLHGALLGSKELTTLSAKSAAVRPIRATAAAVRSMPAFIREGGAAAQRAYARNFAEGVIFRDKGLMGRLILEQRGSARLGKRVVGKEVRNVVQPAEIVDVQAKFAASKEGRRIIGEVANIDPQEIARVAGNQQRMHARTNPREKSILPLRRTASVGKASEATKDKPIGIQRWVAIVRENVDRAIEGMPYARFWYRDSGQAILRHVGGNLEAADKLAAMTAIYSPQQAVIPNIGLAMRAYNQALRGERITVGQAWQQRAAQVVMEGGDWMAGYGENEAIKIRSFYGNLLKHIDHDLMVSKGFTGREVTIDGWMAAAFGYSRNTDTAQITAKQYRAMERVIQDIADKLGVEPEEVQAAVWTSIKASRDRHLTKLPRAAQLARAGNSYQEGLINQTSNFRIAFEGMSSAYPEMQTWSLEQQAAYLQDQTMAILRGLHDNGIIAHWDDAGIGVWAPDALSPVERNPAIAIDIGVGSRPAGEYMVPRQEERMIEGIASIIARHLKQDGVGYMRTFRPVSTADHNAFVVTGLTEQHVDDLARLLDPDVAYLTQGRDGAYMIVAVDPDQVLRKAATTEIAEQFPEGTGGIGVLERTSQKKLAEIRGGSPVKVRAPVREQPPLEVGAHRGVANLEENGFGAYVRKVLNSVKPEITDDDVVGFTQRGGLASGDSWADQERSGGPLDLLRRLDASISDQTAEVERAWGLSKVGGRAGKDRGARGGVEPTIGIADDPLERQAQLAAMDISGGSPSWRNINLRPRIMRIHAAAPQLGWFKSAWIAHQESRYPGYINARVFVGDLPPNLQGLSIPARQVHGQYSTYPFARSQSRSRFGRTTQRTYDQISAALDARNPNAKFGGSVRAARARQREFNQEGKRIDAVIARQEREIAKALPRVHRGDQRFEHALMAAVQAPADVSPRQATEAYLADITHILEDPATLDPFAEGRVVFAKDRGNYGRIVGKVNGDTSEVHFLAPEGGEAFVHLDNELLEPVEDIAKIEANLKRQQRALEGALKSPVIDSDEFLEAVNTASDISREAEAIFRDVMGISEEGLEIRRNRLAARWADEGLIPPPPDELVVPVEEMGEHAAKDLGTAVTGDWARGYWPHRQYASEGAVGSVQIGSTPAAGDVIGKVRPKPGSMERRSWRGVRYMAGDVEANPRVVTNLLRNRMRFVRTLRARNMLYQVGDNLKGKIPGKGRWVIIRNQTEPAETIPGFVRQGLQEPSAYSRAFADVDESVLTSADNTMDWILSNMNDWYVEIRNGEFVGGRPAWVSEKELENLRIVPERVARVMLGDAFYTAPRNWFTSLIATINNGVRTAVIYTPYGGTRYVAKNTVQNQVLEAFTHPRAFMQGRKTAQLFFQEKDIADAVRIEVGSIQATAGLPEVLRTGTRVQRLEKRTNEAMRAAGQFFGDITDEPWRMQAWFNYAREYGFKTKAEIRELLNSDAPGIARVRQQIAQYVRDDMIDFDAIPPQLRETLTRYVFIAPFMVGSTKWPIMFAREYPFRAALLMAAAYWSYTEAFAEPGVPRSVREWGRIPKGVPVLGGRDMGWVSPIQPAAENAQRLVKTGRETWASRHDKGGAALRLAGLSEFLGPLWREVFKAADDRGSRVDNILSDLIPLYSTGKKLSKGGSIMEQIDRALGQLVEPSERRKSERKKAIKKADDDVGILGGDTGDWTLDQVARSVYGWEDYKDLYDRAEYAAKDIGRDSPSYKDRVLLMLTVLDIYYPETDWPNENVINGLGEEQAKEYYESLQTALLKPRDSVASRAYYERKWREENT